MNFLAHAWLSFGDAGLLTGNMISDFVKGRSQFQYPESIQKGIRLHRTIDAFTDAHEATKAAANFFKTPYRLYAYPIVDVLFDHFLANDATAFPGESLQHFSEEVYAQLEANKEHLPPHFQTVFHYMQQENWLYHYRTIAGVQRSLKGLARRAAYMHDSQTALDIFLEHYDALQLQAAIFLRAVKPFALQQIYQPTR